MTNQPDANGFFGPFGGAFISETLAQAVETLRLAYFRYRDDPDFITEFQQELAEYVGRPTPVYDARRLREHAVLSRSGLIRYNITRFFKLMIKQFVQRYFCPGATVRKFINFLNAPFTSLAEESLISILRCPRLAMHQRIPFFNYI